MANKSFGTHGANSPRFVTGVPGEVKQASRNLDFYLKNKDSMAKPDGFKEFLNKEGHLKKLKTTDNQIYYEIQVGKAQPDDKQSQAGKRRVVHLYQESKTTPEILKKYFTKNHYNDFEEFK